MTIFGVVIGGIALIAVARLGAVDGSVGSMLFVGAPLDVILLAPLWALIAYGVDLMIVSFAAIRAYFADLRHLEPRSTKNFSFRRLFVITATEMGVAWLAMTILILFG